MITTKEFAKLNGVPYTFVLDCAHRADGFFGILPRKQPNGYLTWPAQTFDFRVGDIETTHKTHRRVAAVVKTFGRQCCASYKGSPHIASCPRRVAVRVSGIGGE